MEWSLLVISTLSGGDGTHTSQMRDVWGTRHTYQLVGLYSREARRWRQKGCGAGEKAVIIKMAIEDFKLERFREDHPGSKFPSVESLPESKRRQLKQELALRLGLPRETEALEVVKRLHESFVAPSSYDATEAAFNLRSLVKDLDLETPENVYINWDQFDHVDKIRFADLADYFVYIWYSVSDDIEIFDDTLRWAIAVRHDGAVAFVPMISP